MTRITGTWFPVVLPAALGLMALGACSGAPQDVAIAPETVRSQLAEGRTFEVLPEASELEVYVRTTREDAQSRVALDMLGGALELRVDSDGSLAMADVEIPLDDVVIGPEVLPPHGLHLTGVRLSSSVEIEGETSWSFDEREAFAEATTTLTLDWAVVTREGRVVPLGSQEVGPIEIDAHVFFEDGRLAAEVNGAAHGPIWSWLGLVTLADPSFRLRLVEAR